MRVNSFLGIIIFLFLMCTANACYPIRHDGPYKGRVIDAETGKPLEGVVVLGVWYKEIVTPAGGVGSYYDAKETVTDKNGEFEIKGMGMRILTNIGPIHVLIFKAGYAHIGLGLWESLKLDGGLLKKKVTWEGERAIIPLRKLTMEERKKRIIARPSVPDNKMTMLTEEVNKERIEEGLSPL
jgi:hypothetical protein